MFKKIKAFWARMKLAWAISKDKKALEVGKTLKKFDEDRATLEKQRQALVAKAQRVVAELLPETRWPSSEEDKSRLEIQIESAGILTEREADQVLLASQTKHTIPNEHTTRGKLALARYKDQMDKKNKIQQKREGRF